MYEVEIKAVLKDRKAVMQKLQGLGCKFSSELHQNENRISSGWHDVALSELGIKRSKELREQIKDKKFDIIFCSDFKRAIDSAKLAFEGIAQIITDKRLRECNYGRYNAKPLNIVGPLKDKFVIEKFPEGESYEDVKARIQNFLEFLKKNYNEKNVAVMAHEAPQLALDVLLKGKTWEQAFLENWRKTKAWQPGWEYIVG
ncbi:MAG: histidine phosphatase family protein [Patescibacteria group bacterium]